MNISAAFIRRPVMATLLMAAFMLAGIYGYVALPVSELPNVDSPTIDVTAQLPGADAETMSSSVATPLEKQFSLISGLDSMTSTSGQGNTRITLQFRLDRNIDAAAQDVQAAIAAATRQLPRDMPNPPSMRKSNPADEAVFYLSASSETLPLSVVDQYVENILIGKLSSIDGVAQAEIYGQARPAVRIQVDPDALAVRGIGIDELANAIRNTSVNLATGSLDGRTRSAVIHTDGQLRQASEYRQQIITYREGAPVRFADVANVIDNVENPKLFGSWKGRPSITIGIRRQPGANTISVVDAIKAALPDLITQLPPSIKIETYLDRSNSIRRSVEDVQFTLLLSAALVVGVILVFLRTISATFIPSLALPIAIVGTFAGMAAMGYSLNNLTLMALTLCVAFVVDDAIVMLENIMRHVEAGKAPMEASLIGSKEVSFTIPSMTLALAAVFIPVIFMGGVVGKLLHGDDRLCRSCVRHRVADVDAHAVRPSHQARRRGTWTAPFLVLPRQRTWPCRRAKRLRTQSSLEPQPSPLHLRIVRGEHPHDGAVVPHHAAGLPPGGGFAAHQCLDRGRQRHLVRRNAPPPGRGGPHRRAA
jgi:multidrug efflux pump subunit AcrB